MNSISRHIKSKIDNARLLLSTANRYQISLDGLADDLYAIEIQYNMTVSSICAKSYILINKQNNSAEEYLRLIISGNFIDQIDNIVIQIKEVLQNLKIIVADVKKNSKAQKLELSDKKEIRDSFKRILESYIWGCELSSTISDKSFTSYEQCTACGKHMLVDLTRSELICSDSKCGAIQELCNTTIEDVYRTESQKPRSGTFNPNRHFQDWWIHILAREPEEELGDKNDPMNFNGEKLINNLKYIVARDNKILRRLTINDIRSMLRELGKTDLNKNASLILKKITGISPPILSEDITIRVENLFTKANEISERIRRSNRTNRNYYPYYIYKILDHVLDKSDRESRRILCYIYIQSKDTVEADDADWEEICKELVEIKYKPTNRDEAMKYFIV